MVLAKTSRKGKKAWRRNVDTQDIEHAFEERTQRARQAGEPVEQAADSSLFFVDQGGEQTSAAPVAAQTTRRQRQAKPLRSQAILDAAHSAKPVKLPGPKPARKRKLPSGDSQPSRKRPKPTLSDVWAASRQETARPRTRQLSAIPAVEVTEAGASFNPDARLHQAVLARAVAEETLKANKELLRASGPPRRVLAEPELDTEGLQVELDEDDEDENDSQTAEAAHGRQPGKKTRAQRNKEQRLRDDEQALAERRQLKDHKRQLTALRQYQAELSEEAQEQAARRERRAAVQADRALHLPPRLGKHKFQPESTQVLLREELHGSLRKLRSNPMLLRERYSSLQKRGIIEPRVPIKRRKAKRVHFQTGDRADLAQAGQDEINALRKKKR